MLAIGFGALVYETVLLPFVLHTRGERKRIEDQVRILEESKARNKALVETIKNISNERKQELLSDLLNHQTIHTCGGKEISFQEGSERLKKLNERENFLTGISITHVVCSKILALIHL